MSLPSLASLSLGDASGAPEAPTGAPEAEQQQPSVAEEVFQRPDFRNLILSFLASSSSPNALSFVSMFCMSQKLICDDSTYKMIVTQHIGPPMTDLVQPGEVTRLWPQSGGLWERVFATIMVGLRVLPRYQQLAFIDCTHAQRARWRIQLERAMEYRVVPTTSSAARSEDPIWGDTTIVHVHPELRALVSRLEIAGPVPTKLPRPSIRLSELGTLHEYEDEAILSTLRTLFVNGGSLDTAIDVSNLAHTSWPTLTSATVSDLLFYPLILVGIRISMQTVKGILHMMVDMGMSTERILAFYTDAPLETSPQKNGSFRRLDIKQESDRDLMAGTHDSQNEQIMDTVDDDDDEILTNDPRFSHTHPLIWIYMSKRLTSAFTDKNPFMKQVLFRYWFSVFASDISNPCPPLHVQTAIGKIPHDVMYSVEGFLHTATPRGSPPYLRLLETKKIAQALKATEALAKLEKAFAWLEKASESDEPL